MLFRSPLRNAAYVLPNTPQAREDLAWIREEIQALKGQATLLEATTLDPGERQALVDAFRSARAADYAALRKDLERALKSTQRAARGSTRAAFEKTLRALRDRTAALDAIDFFAAPNGQEARDALNALEARMPKAPVAAPAPPGDTLDPAQFRGRTWVTRPRPGVDRMSSAWLIRRFLDPKARFRFAETPSGAEIPFDMYTGDFSHQGPLCTFEVLVRRFGLADPALVSIGQIVHDLDMKETRYNLAETAAVGRMVEGFRQAYADDATLLEHGMAMFEALSHSFGKTQIPKSKSQNPGGGKKR